MLGEHEEYGEKVDIVLMYGYGILQEGKYCSLGILTVPCIPSGWVHSNERSMSNDRKIIRPSRRPTPLEQKTSSQLEPQKLYWIIIMLILNRLEMVQSMM